MKIEGSCSSFDPEVICNLLVACLYFRINHIPMYNTLLLQLVRLENSIRSEILKDLQLVELIIRSNYFKELEKIRSNHAVFDFLSRIKDKDVEEIITSSPLQREIGRTGTFISYTLIENVKIGPYFIDFLNPINLDSHMYLSEDKLELPPLNLKSSEFPENIGPNSSQV
ncbi:hypothetical protein BEWA_018360 [Theileria equi strain WA]|uniref:Uncharacterized protein n=1 Tax=Theileria equi strain WA TaxID=1537102 RepID=L0ATM0_THEEQ|nr:hypothetical protein BEWA_018360 [Theileria equi strain WA]AFZ78992.1 hypothetical protein BEWA_018360 [Theileria equi strain WA]|eukprot:XP_004828658.1 hypothetical protein BEWA_018360 [Theileria equi strain WA]